MYFSKEEEQISDEQLPIFPCIPDLFLGGGGVHGEGEKEALAIEKDKQVGFNFFLPGGSCQLIFSQVQISVVLWGREKKLCCHLGR